MQYQRSSAAARLDAELFNDFTIDQLMELAGLAVSQAIFAVYPPSRYKRVLISAGPGNNGGDALVCARHLAQFGYCCVVVYPKQGAKGEAARLFPSLKRQLQALGVPITESLPPSLLEAASQGADELTSSSAPLPWDVAVDGVFGFSFGPDGVRAPFDTLIAGLRNISEYQAASDEIDRFVGVDVSSGRETDAAARQSVRLASSVRRPGGVGIPLVSIDVPSGWDVDCGDTLPRARGGGLRPSMLVSLTAPKPCAAGFTGPHHWLGGRFVPPRLLLAYGLAELKGGAEGGAARGTGDADGNANEPVPVYQFHGSSQVLRLA